MIEVPALDTITFDELVDEGRGLIPRFAPEWTDHNLHDPGMTLLDLLAWFVEQQVYRIGFVGDAHLAAFAALLGIRPRSATPARGLLWPRAGAGLPEQTLAAGTRANPVDQPYLAFAVSRDLRLTAARIDRIDARGPGGARRIRPDETDSVLLDGGCESLELILDPPLEAAAAVSLGLAYGGALADPASAPVRIDYRGDGWHRADPSWLPAASGPETAGTVLIGIPAEHGPVDRLRLDLDAGLPRRMVPTRIALNVVPVVQIEALPALKIGEGTGWPGLEAPFDPGGGTIPEPGPGFRPPAISTILGAGPRMEWSAVPDFSSSGPADRHFVLDQRRRVVRFGNGVNGRAPAQGEQISRGALDVTLGAAGNLAAAVDWEIAGVGIADGGGFGRNRDPVSGGKDAWSRDDLLDEMRRQARRRRAMLTDEELAVAAADLEGYGIERAEVLPRYLPMLPDHEVPGARALLLRAAPGVATDLWLDSVERALAPRRVLGERLAVLTPTIIEVDVQALLLVAAGADRPRIEAEAERRLRERLAATPTRAGQEIEPWPSGRPVTAGELETLIASVPGIVAVEALRIARADGALAADPLRLGRTEIAVASRIDLRCKAERG